jgi:hypothetical protein
VFFFFLGNFSNPCINRWGLNSFWSSYWYADLKYYQFLQQDVMFHTILKIYLNYGAEAPQTFFQDKRWYKKQNYKFRPTIHLDYRWLTRHEVDLGYSIKYIFRIPNIETFDSRITLMRYNKWYIISASWCQPDKLVNKRHRISQVSHQLVTDKKLRGSFYKNKKVVIRLKTLIQSQLTSCLQKNSSYIF